MIKTKYKIQYKGNTRRYLVNDRWVTARGVPELREKQDQTDSQYINSERGKIIPARISAVSAPKQRKLAQAIKRARVLALIPYLER